MDHVIADPSRAALAVETNLFELFRQMAGSLSGAQLVEGEHVSMHLAHPTNPMFKGAWRTRVDPAGLQRLIDRTIEWFEERGAPFFFWWTGPQTEAAGLGPALEERGLIAMAEQASAMAEGMRMGARGSPGMVADLHDVPLDALDHVPDGFEFSRVRSDTDLADFKQVLIEVYGLPGPMADGWVQAATEVGIDRTPWRLYLGRLDGRAVATNMVFRGAGVAGVYAVATLPDVRGRGIGGAITLGPLLEDREAGIRYAVLFSTLVGIGAYRRIGFREVDVWIDRYLWRRS